MQTTQHKARVFTGWRRQAYLDCISSGMRRLAASAACGINPSTVWRAERAEPEFARQVEEAERQACDFVEEAVWKAAVSGNMTAAKFWLCNRDSSRWRQSRKYSIEEAPAAPVNFEQQVAQLEAFFANPNFCPTTFAAATSCQIES